MKSLNRVCLFAAILFLTFNSAFAQNAQAVSEQSQEQTGKENQDAPEVVLNETAEDNIISDSSDFSSDGVSDENLFDDDLESMFDDSTDTEAIIVQKTETQTEEKKGIIFTGNLSTRLGGYVYYYPFDISPGATFESTISFFSKPSKYFAIRGSLLASFPKMEIGLYELYINYALWDYAYIMAGKKEVTWGNGRIFDTNILDDQNENDYDPEKLLYDKPIEIDKSKFTVQLSVPVRMLNFVGLINYKDYKNRDSFDASVVNDLAYAAMIEANIKNVSFDVFWKMWAQNDEKPYDPAIGCNFNFQLSDFHFYTQYFMHIKGHEDKIIFPRVKATGSVWWATTEKINLGFVLEYQFVYDYLYGDGYLHGDPVKKPDSSEFFKNYLAFEGVWGRINGSPFTVALKYFHDFNKEYGTIVPGLKIHDLLPDADLDIGLPIYYGSEQRYGVAVQLKLNVNF